MLLREADKLKNDLHIGCMDKYYMFVYETVATLFDYFDTDALLVFSEGSKLKERMRTTLWQWGEDVRGLLAEGVLCRGLDMYTCLLYTSLADWVLSRFTNDEMKTLKTVSENVTGAVELLLSGAPDKAMNRYNS